jgi:hypothetical protein
MEIEAQKGHWSFQYVNEVEIKAQKTHLVPFYMFMMYESFVRKIAKIPVTSSTIHIMTIIISFKIIKIHVIKFC